MNIYDSLTINNRVAHLVEIVNNTEITLESKSDIIEFFKEYNILFYGGTNEYGDFEWINESNNSEYTRIDVQGFFEQLIMLSTKSGYRQKGDIEWVA